MLIDGASFKKKSDRPSAPLPTQGDLFESLGHLDNHCFEVIDTRPMGRAIEITLRLTLPAQKTAGG